MQPKEQGHKAPSSDHPQLVMKPPIPLHKFFSALNSASSNNFLPLHDYLARLKLHLRGAALRGECDKYSRHVDHLLLAAAFASICSWDRRHRKWSRRIGRMLSAQLPPDLHRALRRIDLHCRDHVPNQSVPIRAPARWRSRSWLVVPIPGDGEHK